MEAPAPGEERARTLQSHRRPPLSGKIRIFEYDAERQIGEALQHRMIDSIDGPFAIWSTPPAPAESEASMGYSRKSQRVILMDLDPQAATSAHDLSLSFDGLTAILQALCVQKDMIAWLTLFAEEQILGSYFELVPRKKTFHSVSELPDGCETLMFTWSRICSHDSRDGRCHYLGTGCHRKGWQGSEPHANEQAAAVIQNLDSIVVLFSAHCPSAHSRRRPVNQILSQKVMARSDTINSGELLRTQMLEELCRLIIQDESAVINRLEASLIHINEDIGDEALLREGAKQWQKLLGQWRVHFHTRRAFEHRYMQLLDDVFASDPARDRAELLQLTQLKQRRRREHDEFEVEVKHVRELLESTFNAIMQTLSIIESQKAICEAEYVTRLTQLAFFFIPLSYVAGVCGMNIAEFGDGSLKAWIWAVTSVGVLATTYLFFYYTDIYEYVISPLRARITRRRNRRRSANTKDEAATA